MPFLKRMIYSPMADAIRSSWIDASEMSAADEVTLVDTVNGANSCALAATGTERVVDGREVVYNLDSAVRTGLLALHTADTAVGAHLSCHSTLIVVGALNDNSGGIVDKVYDTVRALSYTDTAADTFSGVDLSYTVLDEDRVLRADCRAVTVAKTCKVTYLVTAVNHVCGKTALVTLVFKLSLYCVAGAVAGNVSNLFHNVLCLNTEDSRDLLCHVVTAGNTEVGRGGCLVCESLCIAVTAGVAAGTAVGTGQTLTDSYSGLILFYGKEYCRNGEKHSTEYCKTEKKEHGE